MRHNEIFIIVILPFAFCKLTDERDVKSLFYCINTSYLMLLCEFAGVGSYTDHGIPRTETGFLWTCYGCL